MSQEQPQRPVASRVQEEAIKYGDVFNVYGELASQPIAPVDAATMQAAENRVMGQTQRGGPAAVMQSAATINERAGLVGHRDATEATKVQGVTVSEATVFGHRIITESVAGQVVGQYVQPNVPMTSPGGALDPDAITIGEALEVTALTAGDKPVEESDAAAIQAAEVRALGTSETPTGSVAAIAQSAATLNTRTMRDEDKITLSDVLSDATAKMPGDKPVTREDAERVIGAEVRNDPIMSTTPGGVAASMAAAARLNQRT